MTRLPLFPLSLMLFLNACAPAPVEGRAAAILDASEPEVRAHAAALVDGNITTARQTGARLFAVLGLWYD